jgi:hypothetical protein
MSSAAELMDEWADRYNWNHEIQLNLCLEYIDRQQDNQCFEDFLSAQAMLDEEEGFDVSKVEAEPDQPATS